MEGPSLHHVHHYGGGPPSSDLARQASVEEMETGAARTTCRRTQTATPSKYSSVLDGRHQKTLTFEPVQPQQENTPDILSIERLLSAKSTPVPFLDRAETLTILEKWARGEERFAIYVLGGDGGSGKTRLGAELCRRLTEPNTHRRGGEVWKAGFLQDFEDPDGNPPGNSFSLLLVMDYAEAQPETAKRIINTAYRAAEDPKRKRVRIVFLVRRPSPLPTTRQSSNEWVDALRPQNSYIEDDQNAKNDGINSLLDGTPTIVLNEKTLSDRERKELFESAYKSFTEPPRITSVGRYARSTQ